MIRFCQFLSGRNSLESFKKSLDFDFIKNCSNKIYPNLLSYLDYHNPRRYIFDAFDWNKSDRPASHWRVLSVEWENYLEKNNIL